MERCFAVEEESREADLWKEGLRRFGRAFAERDTVLAEYSRAVVSKFPTAHDWDGHQKEIFHEYFKGELETLRPDDWRRYRLVQEHHYQRGANDIPEVVDARKWFVNFQKAARERIRRLRNRLYPIHVPEIICAVVVDAETQPLPVAIIEEQIRAPAEEIPEPDVVQVAEFEGGQYVPWVDELATPVELERLPTAEELERRRSSLERDNRHLRRVGLQVEEELARRELDEVTDGMQSMSIASKGRGRRRHTSLGASMDSKLKKLNEVLEKHFVGYTATYTDADGLVVKKS